MKILFSMARMKGGGAERVVSELANSFHESDHEVSILVTKESNCVYPLSDRIHLIDLSKEDRGILSRVRSIRRCIKENQFDVVISFLTGTNIETIMAAFGLKTPVIISERNNPYVDPKGKLYRILRKMTYSFADGYVFQTSDAQAFFSKKIQKASCVIMNPINPELPDVYTGERTKRIVNVGRLFEQKNQKMFIDAFGEFHKSHDDYIAEIFGDGPMERELTEYICSKGLDGKVLLRGFSKDVISEISDVSMFVMSSDYEGMSNALIEAVGMGIPCISTDHPIGGARMTIEDGVSGFLVPVGDVRAMTEKMTKIADDSQLAKCFSEHGIKLREKLSVRAISKQWLDYIEKIKIGGNK